MGGGGKYSQGIGLVETGEADPRLLGRVDGGADSDFEGFEAWDAQLHRAIALAAHNGLLMNVFDVMNTACSLPIWGSLKRRTSTPERRRCYHAEHTAVVDALRDRDPDGAQAAMRAHLEKVAGRQPRGAALIQRH